MSSTVLQTSKVVVVNDKYVTVDKLNLRRMAKLLSAIEALPDEMLVDAKEAATGTDGETTKTFIGGIIAVLPDIADIVCNVLKNQLTADELLDADFDEVFDLVEAFLEVNNVPKLMKRLGKVKTLATGAKPKVPHTQQTNG